MTSSGSAETGNSEARKTLVRVGLMGAGGIALLTLGMFLWRPPREAAAVSRERMRRSGRLYPREDIDPSGYRIIPRVIKPWGRDATLEQLSRIWSNPGMHAVALIDTQLEAPALDEERRIQLLVDKAIYLGYAGDPAAAYEVVTKLRALTETNPEWAVSGLATVVYLQGVYSLRKGENDNCIMCRGESSCILPISREAVHQDQTGSRRAIEHFTEYLELFPNDFQVRWLLNLAHMTLGQYPDKVDPRYLISLDRFRNSEFDLGRFRDIGHTVGVNRFDQSGGAVMEDFDNDGMLDLAVTANDATESMAIYRNTGDGKFAEMTEPAGVKDQLGGLFCVQTDYNNDGLKDIFIVRGAWIRYPVRPTLLRNDGDWRFTDVTREAGLLEPLNSNSAAWADYDNDGWLDVFVCCESQTNRLYHNNGDGTFENVAIKAGVSGNLQPMCKGAAWLDYDNDGRQDLFLSYLGGGAHLYHNGGNGTFEDVSKSMGIDGPEAGFSCWAWDYDNDGWIDIFATSYDRSVADVVKGMLGEPHKREPNKLFRNREGKHFDDMTRDAGLDLVFAAMGSNFGDLDCDGFLDFYLGTGDPDYATLVPNRMFKGVDGKRFAEITGTTHTGHLQKGHGVSFADWDRDGDTDVFIQMGGAVDGDKYHNILFDNPGQGNHQLTVKLVGKKTNRAAIGARIKAVSAGERPLTVHRVVSSGSSFGANPLEQTIGLGEADRVAALEIYWPTSKTTQVFHDISADQLIEITEFADDYRVIDTKPARAKRQNPARNVAVGR